jgi:hypothetical protein
MYEKTVQLNHITYSKKEDNMPFNLEYKNEYLQRNNGITYTAINVHIKTYNIFKTIIIPPLYLNFYIALNCHSIQLATFV